MFAKDKRGCERHTITNASAGSERLKCLRLGVVVAWNMRPIARALAALRWPPTSEWHGTCISVLGMAAPVRTKTSPTSPRFGADG